MENPNSIFHFLIFLLSIFPLLQQTSTVEFIFNGFNSSDLLLYGNATILSDILTLTNETPFAESRALYPSKIPTKKLNSSYIFPFSTSFIFSMTPSKQSLPGHGIVFVFVPFPGLQGATTVEYMGLFNFTNNGDEKNHVLGIEFDVVKNVEFNDINDNHVGIDVNSLFSKFSHDAGYWQDDDMMSFKELKLNDGENYQVWIEYNDSSLNVTMARVGMKRPRHPLMNVSLNLSEIFMDDMYVGFTSSTGKMLESHRILGWSFSNNNFSISNSLITSGLPSFIPPKESILKYSKRVIAGIAVGGFLIVSFFCALIFSIIKKKQKERSKMEEWELEYWPHRITYRIIEAATKGFREENVIGIGGNGKVFKGILKGGVEIAVKRISHANEGIREFLSEISSIGRLKHRNLVGLRGWCKKESGFFLLAYDYMENGSLDKWIFDSKDEKSLTFEQRIKILKDVASGILYLHEGWESKVLHRDIKASNVLLDKEMNGKLGDFGLARVHAHNLISTTTGLVGTVGYLAPEQIRFGRVSSQTDVYGFGILILEVMCGRRPIEEKKPNLVEWLWKLKGEGRVIEGIDERMRNKGGFAEGEVEKVIHLGMLCSYHDPMGRPTMRQVMEVLEKKEMEMEIEMKEGSFMEKMELRMISYEKEYWDLNMGNGMDGEDEEDFITFEEVTVPLSSTSLSWTDTSLFSGR